METGPVKRRDRCDSRLRQNRPRGQAVVGLRKFGFRTRPAIELVIERCLQRGTPRYRPRDVRLFSARRYRFRMANSPDISRESP